MALPVLIESQGSGSGADCCDAVEMALGIPDRRRSARPSTRDQTCESLARLVLMSTSPRPGQKRSAPLPPESPPKLSEYEQARNANIARNVEKLRKLGLS